MNKQHISFVLIAAPVLTGAFSLSAQSDAGTALQAVAAASNALVKVEGTTAAKPRAVIKSVLCLGLADADALRFEQAEKTFQRALEKNSALFKNITGDIHKDLLMQIRLLSLLADMQMRQGKFEEASQNYRRGLNTARLGISAVSPVVKHLRTGLVLATARRSTPTAAEALFDQLQNSSKQASGDVSLEMAMILRNRIEFRAYTHRIAECAEMAEHLESVSRKVYGGDSPAYAEDLVLQASVIYAVADTKGDAELRKAALPLLERVLEIRQKAFGPADKHTQAARQNIVVLKQELDEVR